MSRSRGFTLVELILVIVIIGILAAVVGPRFFDRQVFDGRLYFEETRAAVRYAQKLALASGCRVQVGLGAGGYSLRRDANCGTGNPANYVAQVLGPDGQPYADAPAPSGVAVVPNSFPLVFDSLGRPSNAANANIGGFVLSVNADTGLVQ
ncbi:prepilin-type N-terminal cleavage/methylation domain-containing protein [Pseudomonas sp. 2FG]|uniref:prepilin-type N-terminal cleavage/methylation domain-containing protein n=1 Tax=Pseudomonas sp. 2FG TaxID=2502191 RepID=UPI0010F7FC47|nr:prepilin-type N-terminal cleavage/methylation domain-containing protein [Pseudomonas sp. 2FG]